MNWFERLRRRQDELASGVDADLVRDNQKRYRLAFGLLCSGFAIGLLVSKIHLPGTLQLIVSGVAAVSFILGLVLAAWARQETGFLSKPDSDEPPKILK